MNGEPVRGPATATAATATATGSNELFRARLTGASSSGW